MNAKWFVLIIMNLPRQWSNHRFTEAAGGSGIFLPSAFCEWLWILVEDVKRY